MTFELGTVLLPALLAPWGWRDRETRRVLVLGGVLATAAVLLCLRVSGPVYAAVPLLDFVGFPWRFLSIATLGMALLAAVGSAQVVERLGARFAATVGFAALAIVPVRDLLGPTAPLPLQPWMLDAEAYRQAEFTATVADEYVPIWARRDEPLPFREGLAATKPAEFTPVNRDTVAIFRPRGGACGRDPSAVLLSRMASDHRRTGRRGEAARDFGIHAARGPRRHAHRRGGVPGDAVASCGKCGIARCRDGGLRRRGTRSPSTTIARAWRGGA